MRDGAPRRRRRLRAGHFGAGASPPPPPASRHHGGGGAHRHHGRAADAGAEPGAGFAAFTSRRCTRSPPSSSRRCQGRVEAVAWLRNIQPATTRRSSPASASSASAASPPPLALDAARRLRPTGRLALGAGQSAGGILVAVTIKYADNILRGFAQGVAIIVGAVGSHYIFASSCRPSSSSASAPSSSPSSTAGRPTVPVACGCAARPSSRPPTTATATAAESRCLRICRRWDRRRRLAQLAVGRGGRR